MLRLNVVGGGISEAVRDHHQYPQEKRVKRNLQKRKLSVYHQKRIHAIFVNVHLNMQNANPKPRF